MKAVTDATKWVNTWVCLSSNKTLFTNADSEPYFGLWATVCGPRIG